MIKSLTSLRFFVIVLVYFHHLSYPGGLGAAAVTLFFVLSGFVMAYNYNHKFSIFDIKKVNTFYVKRLSRIYPLHILTFFFSFPILYYTNFETNFFYALLNILLLQSYYPIGIQVFAFNSLAWFLSNIMFFYLLTPFFLFVTSKYKIMSKPIILCLLLSICFICEIFLSNMVSNIQGYTFGWWFVYISPYLRIFDYLSGIFAGLIFNSIKTNVKKGGVNEFSFILASMAEISVIVFFGGSIYYSRYFPYDAVRMGTCFVPFSLILIFIFSFQRGIVSSILSKKLFVYLGSLSFTIFLIHQIAISYTAIFFLSDIYGMTLELKHLASQLLLLIVIIYLSHILMKFFEEPMSKKILTVYERKGTKKGWRVLNPLSDIVRADQDL